MRADICVDDINVGVLISGHKFEYRSSEEFIEIHCKNRETRMRDPRTKRLISCCISQLELIVTSVFQHFLPTSMPSLASWLVHYT